MIISMTGFGAATFKSEEISIHIQVKSVNGRFLETRFRMPREYSSLEMEMKKVIGSQIHRGTIDININRSSGDKGAGVTVVPNLSLAKSWLQASRTISGELGLDESVSLDTLVRVPEMMQIPEQMEIPDWERKALMQCLVEAVEGCQAERKREGQAQLHHFLDLLDGLSRYIDGIRGKRSTLDAQLKAKLFERLKSIDDQINVDPQRLAQEVVFLLEKADIEEEISRAQTHIKAYRSALKEKGSVGKKLEFYTQELHREINTMGSKTQALEISLDVIEAKTLIERLREQVQNVE